ASVVAILAGVEHAVAAERDLVGADVAGGALRPGDAALIRRRAVHGIAVIDRRAAGEEPARSGRAPVVRERSKQRVDVALILGAEKVTAAVAVDVVAVRREDDLAAIGTRRVVLPVVGKDRAVQLEDAGARRRWVGEVVALAQTAAASDDTGRRAAAPVAPLGAAVDGVVADGAVGHADRATIGEDAAAPTPDEGAPSHVVSVRHVVRDGAVDDRQVAGVLDAATRLGRVAVHGALAERERAAVRDATAVAGRAVGHGR